jgi:hypothetical protein
MSPTPIILAALASSCRVLFKCNHLQAAERREVFELHLQWMELVRSATGQESDGVRSEVLALHMAQFIMKHEPFRQASNRQAESSHPMHPPQFD